MVAAVPEPGPAVSETGHDTKELPAIWSDRAGFEKASATLTEAAAKLEVGAKANDKAAFADGFETMTKACAACHRTYRAKTD